MKNVIVYSLHSNFPKIDTLLQWREMRYSIDKLREFNKEIPVKIYMSPVGVTESATMPLNLENAEVIEFNATAYDGLSDQNLARFVSHKWNSTFDALEKYGYDNALYVDGDTVWYDDPQKLFDKYGNSDYIYTKKDRFDRFVDFMKDGKDIFAEPMNDGVNMVSKKILKYKDYILNERFKRVHEWQEKYKNLDDEEIAVHGIQWTSYQYAISEAMNDIGMPVKFFDSSDVIVASELDTFEDIEQSGATVFHYLNHNAYLFLPFWYTITTGMKVRHNGIQCKVIKINTDQYNPEVILKSLIDDSVYNVLLRDLKTKENMQPAPSKQQVS
jgi:hypothetical protein